MRSDQLSSCFQDENDHAPSFSSTMYTTTVSEVVAIGTSILKVTTSDGDSKENAKARYELRDLEVDSSVSSHFHIDPDEGTIFTKQRLDYEHHHELEFLVVAVDYGVPPLTSSAPVKVHLTN